MEKEVSFKCLECYLSFSVIAECINTEVECPMCKTIRLVPPVSEPSIPLSKKLRDYNISHLHYILPIHNASSILEKGIFCHNIVEMNKILHEDFSNLGVQRRRDKFVPGTRKRLHDFVPLYFATHTPMQYRWTMETKYSSPPLTQGQLIFVEVDGKCVFSREGVFFSDGNAASVDTNFFSDVLDLCKLDWEIIRNKIIYSRKYIRKKAAEALIPRYIPVDWFSRIVVCNSNAESEIIELLKKIEKLFNEKGNSSVFKQSYNFKVEIDKTHYYDEY